MLPTINYSSSWQNCLRAKDLNYLLNDMYASVARYASYYDMEHYVEVLLFQEASK